MPYIQICHWWCHFLTPTTCPQEQNFWHTIEAGRLPAQVCYDHRGKPKNSDCLAWGPAGRNIIESTKLIGERQYLAARHRSGLDGAMGPWGMKWMKGNHQRKC